MAMEEQAFFDELRAFVLYLIREGVPLYAFLVPFLEAEDRGEWDGWDGRERLHHLEHFAKVLRQPEGIEEAVLQEKHAEAMRLLGRLVDALDTYRRSLGTGT